jgi:hypothetical protein
MKGTLLLILLVGLAAASASPIIRERGAIYLSDFGEKPMRLKLLRAAPCYFDIGLTRYAGTLRFPQTVQVEAFGDEACRIRGNAQQGGVAAWLPYAELEPLPENLLADLRAAEARRIEVERLISQNEIALGMTEEEVQRSVGRPQKRTKRAESSGVRQVWEYIRYELVPQTTIGTTVSRTVVTVPRGTNRPTKTFIGTTPGWAANTIYVKVPVGTLAVTFEDGVVTSIDETEGTLEGGGRPGIVVPPINIVW